MRKRFFIGLKFRLDAPRGSIQSSHSSESRTDPFAMAINICMMPYRMQDAPVPAISPILSLLLQAGINTLLIGGNRGSERLRVCPSCTPSRGRGRPPGTQLGIGALSKHNFLKGPRPITQVLSSLRSLGRGEAEPL